MNQRKKIGAWLVIAAWVTGALFATAQPLKAQENGPPSDIGDWLEPYGLQPEWLEKTASQLLAAGVTGIAINADRAHEAVVVSWHEFISTTENPSREQFFLGSIDPAILDECSITAEEITRLKGELAEEWQWAPFEAERWSDRFKMLATLSEKPLELVDHNSESFISKLSRELYAFGIDSNHRWLLEQTLIDARARGEDVDSERILQEVVESWLTFLESRWLRTVLARGRTGLSHFFRPTVATVVAPVVGIEEQSLAAWNEGLFPVRSAPRGEELVDHWASIFRNLGAHISISADMPDEKIMLTDFDKIKAQVKTRFAAAAEDNPFPLSTDGLNKAVTDAIQLAVLNGENYLISEKIVALGYRFAQRQSIFDHIRNLMPFYHLQERLGGFAQASNFVLTCQYHFEEAGYAPFQQPDLFTRLVAFIMPLRNIDPGELTVFDIAGAETLPAVLQEYAYWLRERGGPDAEISSAPYRKLPIDFLETWGRLLRVIFEKARVFPFEFLLLTELSNPGGGRTPHQRIMSILFDRLAADPKLDKEALAEEVYELYLKQGVALDRLTPGPLFVRDFVRSNPRSTQAQIFIRAYQESENGQIGENMENLLEGWLLNSILRALREDSAVLWAMNIAANRDESFATWFSRLHAAIPTLRPAPIMDSLLVQGRGVKPAWLAEFGIDAGGLAKLFFLSEAALNLRGGRKPRSPAKPEPPSMPTPLECAQEVLASESELRPVFLSLGQIFQGNKRDTIIKAVDTHYQSLATEEQRALRRQSARALAAMWAAGKKPFEDFAGYLGALQSAEAEGFTPALSRAATLLRQDADERGTSGEIERIERTRRAEAEVRRVIP